MGDFFRNIGYKWAPTVLAGSWWRQSTATINRWFHRDLKVYFGHSRYLGDFFRILGFTLVIFDTWVTPLGK